MDFSITHRPSPIRQVAPPEQRRVDPWLGLVIGNTRLHWALFQGDALQGVWHTLPVTPEQAHRLVQQQFTAPAWRSLSIAQSIALELPKSLSRAMDAIASLSSPLPLYCASVVPAQTALWQAYPGLQVVTLADVPLADCYPSLGIDRALNLLGAGDRLGWPVIVVDAGTALTFTAGVEGRFVGGAILPGLATQFAALTTETAALPQVEDDGQLPARWASTTAAAIRSGVIYGTLATIQTFVADWQRQHPNSKAVLTGGNGAQLYQWWRQVEGTAPAVVEPNLTFWGLRQLRRSH
ncbi:MAG: pantothenate kinase [Cyanobacteria bacterium P01_C01_bin.120]